MLRNLIIFSIVFFISFTQAMVIPDAASECSRLLMMDESAVTRFTINVDGWSDREITLAKSKKELGAAKTLKYTALLTKGGLDFSEDEIFNDKADLIIGISANGNTQGHTYLIINDQRLDGRMFLAPHTVDKSDWKLAKGVIIRFKNLPQITKDRLAAFLQSEKVLRTPTCVYAACRVLYDEEIGNFANPPDSYFWFPSNLLKHIAQTGLVTKDGVRSEAEIYALNSDIDLVWNNLPSAVKVPSFFFQVLFDPYTWQGGKKKTQENL